MQFAVAIAECDNQLLLRQRPEKGIVVKFKYFSGLKLSLPMQVYWPGFGSFFQWK